MLSYTLVETLAVAVMLVPADAFSGFPRMKQLMKIDVLNPADLSNIGVNDGDDSFELLGDLATLSAASLTQVGRDIRDLLLGSGAPESDVGYTDVPALNSTSCAQDTCCVWKHIADEMTDLFRGESGRCTKWARMAIRLGFHDAGAWSRGTAAQGGGADGSICLTEEYTFPENAGLPDMCTQMLDWYDEWHNQKGFNISMADLIRKQIFLFNNSRKQEMGANVATVVCPLGPRVRSFVGRKDSAIPNKSELLPSPFAEAVDLIRLFRDKTISPHSLVALLGAHTTSQQRDVNVTRAGDPQDSTPGVWDVLYYEETYGTVEAPARVYHFPSDVALAKYSTTGKEWVTFLGSGGQDHWNTDYARAYIRLSLLGVNNINQLKECTRALPARTLEYKNPDQETMDQWLNSSRVSLTSEEIADRVELGGTVDINNLFAGNSSRALEL
ncbi:class II peroxidase [Xylariaceae sp. AK1471]|nr:class II peroxidase [Xylariaceae sp. AK1471]